jgi:hypothetical protein
MMPMTDDIATKLKWQAICELVHLGGLINERTVRWVNRSIDEGIIDIEREGAIIPGSLKTEVTKTGPKDFNIRVTGDVKVHRDDDARNYNAHFFDLGEDSAKSA